MEEAPSASNQSISREGRGENLKTLGAGDRSGSLWVPRLSAETLPGPHAGMGKLELWTSVLENLMQPGRGS